MSYVIAVPEMMTAAAADLGNIGSTLIEEHAAAAAQTIALVPAAADEVSVGIAHLFSGYAEDFHGLASRAAAFQQQFVQNLKTSALSYASVEDAIASFLQGLITSAGSFVNSLNQQLQSYSMNFATFCFSHSCCCSLLLVGLLSSRILLGVLGCCCDKVLGFLRQFGL